MKTISVLCYVGLLVGCAAPHAVRVSCDGRLRPINLSSLPAQGALAGTASAQPSEVAP
jgi:hypothetical protein